MLDQHPDPDVAELEKCKSADHLFVLVEIVEPIRIHGVGDQHVRFLNPIKCRNPFRDEPPWGAAIIPTQKVQGMQLFHSAMELVAADFPQAALDARAKGALAAVSLQHTVNHVLKTWRSFDPDAAELIATDLAGMIGS